MIVKVLILLAVKLALLIIGLCGFVLAGGWVSKVAEGAATVTPLMATVYNYLFDLGAWVPGETLFMALTAAAGILFAGLCMRMLRVVLSLFTGGGGSAG
ncbi:MAG TPA: hypothetical protein VHA79_01525 [Mycobacteriales bacterium]|jgi:hypothetical protein|nr:hypothetical protein [Mycobacteriales bacterium]